MEIWLLQFNVPGESFKPFAVFLEDRDRYMAGLARLDVFHDAGFAGMGTPNDFTGSTILELGV